MPNHVKNRLELIGDKEQIKQFVEAFTTVHPACLYKSYDGNIICHLKDKTVEWSVGWFDVKTGMFKRRGEPDVIGLPDEWEMEITPEYYHFPSFEKVIPPPENIFKGDLGIEEEEMCAREGRPTWYKWNRENWGTKWDSYSCKKEGENIYSFETAWSSVIKIVETMSRQFPEVRIKYMYANEDTGYNCGSYQLLDGIIKPLTNIPEGGSKEAFDIVFKLKPGERKYYKLIDDEYQYIAEE